MVTQYLGIYWLKPILGKNWLVLVDFDGFWVGSLTIKLIYQILAWFLNLGIGPKYVPIGTLKEV